MNKLQMFMFSEQSYNSSRCLCAVPTHNGQPLSDTHTPHTFHTHLYTYVAHQHVHMHMHAHTKFIIARMCRSRAALFLL